MAQCPSRTQMLGAVRAGTQADYRWRHETGRTRQGGPCVLRLRMTQCVRRVRLGRNNWPGIEHMCLCNLVLQNRFYQEKRVIFTASTRIRAHDLTLPARDPVRPSHARQQSSCPDELVRQSSSCIEMGADTQSKAIEGCNRWRGEEKPRKRRRSRLCLSQMGILNTMTNRQMAEKSRVDTACKAE